MRNITEQSKEQKRVSHQRDEAKQVTPLTKKTIIKINTKKFFRKKSVRSLEKIQSIFLEHFQAKIREEEESDFKLFFQEEDFIYRMTESLLLDKDIYDIFREYTDFIQDNNFDALVNKVAC